VSRRFNVAVSVRRFQFSLRTLLVVTLVVAAFFGGAAWQRGQTELKLWRTEQKLEKALLAERAAVSESEALRRRLDESK
jgi:hypothetical protein